MTIALHGLWAAALAPAKMEFEQGLYPTGCRKPHREQKTEYDLVLVNRLMDGDGSSGVAFLTQVKSEKPDLRVMLVSDYAEAQAEAAANGALPGFGKSALFAKETAEILRGALAN